MTVKINPRLCKSTKKGLQFVNNPKVLSKERAWAEGSLFQVLSCEATSPIRNVKKLTIKTQGKKQSSINDR